MAKPNIIFMHSHNTGRYIEPYGHAIPSPHLTRLAREGVLFRQAFSAAPTCSPSRAAFMSGMYPHSCGMFGLAHRGFSMFDYEQHLARYLRIGGYTTVLSGVEHTAPAVDRVGYDRVLSVDDTNYSAGHVSASPADAAVDFLRSDPPAPFFLSVGLNETHRPFPSAEPQNHPAEDPRYALPVRPFPDTPETRAEAADLKAAVRVMDEHYGAVLDALSRSGQADNSYVFCFTDHGLQFPRNMCNLTVHGAGVYLIVRGPEHFAPGAVCDALVGLVDLFPTVCELAGVDVPDHVEGCSLLPLVDGEVDSIHDYLFGEINYHAAYEPTRSIRTARYNLIRRYDSRERLVLPNVDDTSSKTFLLAMGWETEPRDRVMLFDDMFDPDEVRNIADSPRTASVRRELESALREWMERTSDPLLRGDVPAPRGARVNDVDGLSPRDEPLVIE